ncbi:MAG: pantoate--beta-alanine ligase [Proteobacteria bacterium]|nr:pantoate--beta-alanine ligase [Pseudomonadota bacterium]MBU1738748.1 pantoate--beta-alanine ligase [Pseudomonadota bacterium]
MQIISDPAKMSEWALQQIRKGQAIALVPTMGFFHEGHLALMRTAAEHGDKVVVSLFVNPLQFAPGEDLDAYPRDFERDRAMAEEERVDVLFAPVATDMYGSESRTRVSVGGLTEGLCGRSRPGHFDGVCTVVAKLFNLVMPQVAVFGSKDFQQLAVIRRMVRDLDWQIKIIDLPTVREKDGLAMSSRNSYLTREERVRALCLFKGIQMARDLAAAGVLDSRKILREIENHIASSGVDGIEYLEIVNSENLHPVSSIDESSLLAMAVKIGKTRLIDNAFLLQN